LIGTDVSYAAIADATIARLSAATPQAERDRELAEAEKRGYAAGLADLPIWYRRGMEDGFRRVKAAMEGKEIGPFMLSSLDTWRSIGAMRYVKQDGED
jgi:hypothetical protein